MTQMGDQTHRRHVASISAPVDGCRTGLGISTDTRRRGAIHDIAEGASRERSRGLVSAGYGHRSPGRGLNPVCSSTSGRSAEIASVPLPSTAGSEAASPAFVSANRPRS